MTFINIINGLLAEKSYRRNSWPPGRRITVWQNRLLLLDDQFPGYIITLIVDDSYPTITRHTLINMIPSVDRMATDWQEFFIGEELLCELDS